MIPTRPDNGPYPAGPATVPGDGGRLHEAWAWITELLAAVPDAVWYLAVAAIVVAGLISSIRIALGRRTTTRRVKSDKFLTFLAAAVATGVVATGMWKFFGDVLNIANPYARAALFAFFEIAMLASAFRSRRFRLDRAAKREHSDLEVDNRIDVDGIAVWVLAALSGLFAASDEPTTSGKVVRVVAPLLAAWMWERGLAGELMQFTRGVKRLNWTLTAERVFVWLGVAEPSGRAIGDVDRKRRIAQFARTAYRYNLLVEQGRTGWRVSWTRWRLRRLTESANEHLKLATDTGALAEVRAQLALLYGVEDGTSRRAVDDLHPLRPVERKAIAAKPFEPATAPTDDASEYASEAGHEPATIIANPDAPWTVGRDDKTFALHPAYAEANEAATTDASTGATPEPRKPAVKRAAKAATDGVHPTAVKLAKYLAKYPADTNVELAKRMRVGDRTVSRYRAEAEAFIAAQKAARLAPITTPIPEPKPAVTHGVNGYHLTPAEETP